MALDSGKEADLIYLDFSKAFDSVSHPKPRDRNLLQSDLDSLHQWSSKCDLNFNTKKCVALRFSRRKTSAPTQGYVLNKKTIKFAATQNDLGILVSNDLKWSSHVINIVAKANRMLGFLRGNCFHLTDVNARRLLYLSLVRSHLSFGCEIWAPQDPSADLLRFEGIQRRATKFILKDYECSYPDRLKKLNLIPLSYWHEIKDIIFFYECKSGMYELDTNQFITLTRHKPVSSIARDRRRRNFISSVQCML